MNHTGSILGRESQTVYAEDLTRRLVRAMKYMKVEYVQLQISNPQARKIGLNPLEQSWQECFLQFTEKSGIEYFESLRHGRADVLPVEDPTALPLMEWVWERVQERLEAYIVNQHQHFITDRRKRWLDWQVKNVQDGFPVEFDTVDWLTPQGFRERVIHQ